MITLRSKWRFSQLIAVLLIVVFVTSTLLPATFASPPVRANAKTATLDLPAMALTSTDLEEAGFPGFGVAGVGDSSSGWRTSGDALADSVAGIAIEGANDRDMVNFEFLQTGWLRQYRRVLAQPASDSSHANVTVYSEVAEFSSAAGAGAGLTLLMTGGDNIPAGDETIGDRIEVRRFQSFDIEHHLVIGVQVRNLVGFVEITKYASQDEQELEPALLLAKTLAGRMQAGLGIPSPGLSDAALHLASPANPAEFEGYWRLAGDTPLLYAESAEDYGARNDALGDAVDVYQLNQMFWPAIGEPVGTRYELRLYRFADATAASRLLAEIPDRVAKDVANAGGIFKADLADNPTGIGDESVTFKIQDQRWDAPTYGYRIYTRVGADLARLSVDASGNPSISTIVELAQIQVECLAAGSCAAAGEPPAALSGLDCPRTVRSDDPPADPQVIESAVPLVGADPARTGVQPGPRPNGAPSIVWTAEATGAAGKGLVISDDLIAFQTEDYIYSNDTDSAVPAGYLHAVKSNGEDVWCVPTGLAFTDPAFADGMVFTQAEANVGDHSQRSLLALDAETGAERWRATLGFAAAGYRGSVTVSGGTVFATAGYGALYAFDETTGAPRWLFDLAAIGDPNKTTSLFTQPAIASEKLFVAAGNTVYALNSISGGLIWQFDAPSSDEYFGIPSVDDGVVFIGGNEAVYAIDATTGKQQWHYDVEMSGGSRLAVASGTLYIATGSTIQTNGDAFIAALAARSGELLWRYDFAGFASAPAVAGDVLYIGFGRLGEGNFEEGALLALNARDGKTLWSYPLAGPANAPVVIDGQIFVASNLTWDGTTNAIVHDIDGSEPPIAIEDGQ